MDFHQVLTLEVAEAPAHRLARTPNELRDLFVCQRELHSVNAIRLWGLRRPLHKESRQLLFHRVAQSNGANDFIRRMAIAPEMLGHMQARIPVLLDELQK